MHDSVMSSIEKLPLHLKATIDLHDIKKCRINLRQWEMLHAVVRYGSFARAAEVLHVTQPAISYTISKLEEQLGMSVLKLDGRKARITESGNLLLQRARLLLKQASEIEELARELRSGTALTIHLTSIKSFPSPILLRALKLFSEGADKTRVLVREVPLSDIEHALKQREVDIAIHDHVPHGFYAEHLVETEYIAVAHVDHPLHNLGRDLNAQDLKGHMQITLGSCHVQRGNHRFHVPTSDYLWSVNEIDVAVKAVSESVGFGWLPRRDVQYLLDNGSLRILPLQYCASYTLDYFLVFANGEENNFYNKMFAELLRDALSGNVGAIQ